MDLPHFEHATRRAFLRRGLVATGTLTAAGVLLAACSKSDADTFGATTSGAGPATTGTAPATTMPAAAPTTTEAPANTAPRTTEVAAPTPPPPTDSVAGNAVAIAFAYTAAESSARVRNPYIAVWVENPDGELVALVGAWYSTRDAKYLRELTDFTAATTATTADELAAVSGATRSAGQYQLQWDGRGLGGTALTGPLTLWVEAAREHGPHSVTSGPLTLPLAEQATIAGNGELSDIAVTVA